MKRTERGFAVGAILLAVVLMAVVAAAMVLGNRGPSASSADHGAKVNAATLIQQGSNLRIGLDVMQARGITPASITFDTSATAGLFNPSVGGAQTQTVPATAISNSATTWLYRPVKIKGVGTDAGTDYAVLVGTVKDAVCAQINQALYNAQTIPASGISYATWSTGGAADLSAGVAGIDGRTEMCVSTSDGADNNLYYSVTAAQ